MKKQAKRRQIQRQRQAQKRQRRVGAAELSRQRELLERSQSPDLPADKRVLLERFDGYAGLRYALSQIAQAKEEWAGIPMPVEGCNLVVERSYPNAAALEGIIRGPVPEVPPDAEKLRVRNCFWSTHEHAEVWVYEKPDGRVDYVLDRKAPHSLELALGSLSCADAWGIEQEQRALKLLGTLIAHRQFKQYLLTGMFVERSRRSDIHYIFRRLKPTVAFTMRGNRQFLEPPDDGQMKILCTLCLHPIAYYEGSWGGAMCPTDDVVAHLMLMRGDEHLFWRRANQHPAWRREAGV